MSSTTKAPTKPTGRSSGVKTPLTSRERGKYYRARLRLHHSRLLRHVAKLHQQVADLKLLASLQEQLASSPAIVRRAVMKCLRDLLDESARVPSLKTPLGDAPDSPSRQEAYLQFGIRSFLLQGPREAPILVLTGFMRGKMSQGTISRLYCCLPGNTALLDALVDKEVSFASTRSIFFGRDGAVHNQAVETDYSATMTALVPSLRGLCLLLHELKRVESNAVVKEEGVP